MNKVDTQRLLCLCDDRPAVGPPTEQTYNRRLLHTHVHAAGPLALTASTHSHALAAHQLTTPLRLRLCHTQQHWLHPPLRASAVFAPRH